MSIENIAFAERIEVTGKTLFIYSYKKERPQSKYIDLEFSRAGSPFSLGQFSKLKMFVNYNEATVLRCYNFVAASNISKVIQYVFDENNKLAKTFVMTSNHSIIVTHLGSEKLSYL